MRQYTLRLWDGNRRSERTVCADSYHEACWKLGVAGYPPGYIWSLELS